MNKHLYLEQLGRDWRCLHIANKNCTADMVIYKFTTVGVKSTLF